MRTPHRPLFKSVFAKYMALISVFLVVAILLFGITQITLSANYWGREQEQTMVEDARMLAVAISNQTERNATGGYSLHMDENGVLPTLIRTVAETSDVGLLVTGMDGSVLIRSTDLPSSISHLAEADIAHVSHELTTNGSFFEISTLGEQLPARHYVAAAPIVHSQTPVGYVFILSPSSVFGAYVAEQLEVYLLAAVVALVLLLILSYVMAYRLVRPLRQMAAVTKRFGEGDFSGRVTVYGKDEISELGQSLNEMAVSLASVEGMSRSFVANVSHELKTPMTTISGFIDGILDGTIPPEKQNHYLRIVSDEVRRLSRLVNAMLDLSRIDNGTLAFHPVTFDLAELVCKTALSFEQRVEQKNVQIEGLDACCTPLPLLGDFDLLGQVVYNLLDNAVKFVNEGGTIRIRLCREADRTCLAIRNTGSGVPADELPHLFERFYKSDKSRGIDKTGVGLGLYIVHHVIQLHGGEITVQSDGESYTEFAFWLPTGNP